VNNVVLVADILKENEIHLQPVAGGSRLAGELLIGLYYDPSLFLCVLCDLLCLPHHNSRRAPKAYAKSRQKPPNHANSHALRSPIRAIRVISGVFRMAIF
jgi:hypothetical protein